MTDNFARIAGELDRRGADPSMAAVLRVNERLYAQRYGDWLQLDDEEPWTPELPADAGVDLLDGAVVGAVAWLAAFTLTAAALVAVLVAIAVRRNGS